MAKDYFPIFSSIKKSGPARPKVVTPVEEEKPKATSLKLPCAICYRDTDYLKHGVKTENDDEYYEESIRLFETYTRMFRVQLKPQMQWNFRSEMLPFCRDCLPKVKTVIGLQETLVFVEKQIEQSLLEMKTLVLNSQRPLKAKNQKIKEPFVTSLANGKISKLYSYYEKIDHFRSLITKDLNPEVAICRNNLLMKVAPFEMKQHINDVKETPDKIRIHLPVKLTPDEDGEQTVTTYENELRDVDHCTRSDSVDKFNIPEKRDIKNSSYNSELLNNNLNKNENNRNLGNTVLATPLSMKKRRSSNLRSLSSETKERLNTLLIITRSKKTKITGARKFYRKMGNSYWKCKLCQKHFITDAKSTTLARHFDQVHQKIKPFQCRICMAQFYDSDRCKHHIIQVHAKEMTEKSFENMLQKGAPTTVDENHRRKITEKGLPTSKPKDIEMSSAPTTQKRRPTSNYKQFFKKESNGYYKCKLCLSRIMLTSSLRRHFLTLHGPLEKLKCKHCKQTFLSESKHELHLKTVHNEDTRKTKNEIKECRVRISPISISPQSSKNILSKQNCQADADDSLPVSMSADNEKTPDTICESEKLVLSMAKNSNIVEPSSIRATENKNEDTDVKETVDHLLLKLSDNENSVKDNPAKIRRKKSQGLALVTYPPHIERGIIRRKQTAKTIYDNCEDGAIKGTVRCTICSIVVSKGKFSRHYTCIHNRFAGRYQCKYCKQIFFDKSGCAVHIRTRHYMEKPFQCSRCPAAFSTVGSRNSHMKKCVLCL